MERIKIKAKLNAYTRVNPFEGQFVDAPHDDLLYGRKNGGWVEVEQSNNEVFRSEIEDMLSNHVIDPDNKTIKVVDDKLTAVALYDEEYDNVLADDNTAHALGNPITATSLREMLTDLVNRLSTLKARVDAADTQHDDHEVIWSNFDEINKIIGEITDLKLTIQQLDGTQVEFDPTSITNAIKTLESIIYSNFDIINGNVGDISDLQQALKNHNVNVSSLSQAIEELTQVIYDNFDKINETISDVSDLQNKLQTTTAELSEFKTNQEILNSNMVTLSDNQNIAGVKTFTGGVAVNSTTQDNKQTVADLRLGTDIKLEQQLPGKKFGVAFDTANESISIYNVVGELEQRLDIDNDGIKYNGKEVATTDQITKQIDQIHKDTESIKAVTIDSTTIGANVESILGYVNSENGGSLIYFGFKVGNANILGTATKVVNSGSTAETTVVNSAVILKAGSYYWCCPERIDTEAGVTSVYFTCTNGLTLGKSILCLTSNGEAKLAGQDFSVDNNIVTQNFFSYKNIAESPLEHLTIVYHA